MDKRRLMYLYNIILVSSKKEEATDTYMVESQKHAKWSEEQKTACCIICYVKFSKRQNYRDRKYWG